MSVEKVLEEKLSMKFHEFFVSVNKEVDQVFNLNQSQMGNELRLEQERMQFIIDEHDRDLEDLQAQFDSLKRLKQNRTLRLYTAFVRRQNSRKLTQVLVAWISHFSRKSRSKSMRVYIVNFYRRGILRKLHKAWKNETQLVKREKYKEDCIVKTQEAIRRATQKVCDESDALRAIICGLTDDLRNESLAKIQMKVKFEQAMYRGMSALSQENEGIHEDVMSHSQGFNQMDRNLMYSSEPLINLHLAK